MLDITGRSLYNKQMTILNKIRDYKLQEVQAAKRVQTLADFADLITRHTAPRGFLQALRDTKRIGLIAEIKKSSPSKGLIRQDFDVETLAQAYEKGGATCLSILTDKPSFHGDDHFLEIGRNAVSLPVLRKDFMFDPYQIVQSRALGADCILLIMSCIENNQAIELEEAAIELGMDVLIETHNEVEIDRALMYLKSDMIGINNRDLHSFVTDISVTEQLVSMVPQEKLCISESGIFTKDDIKRLQKSNINSFLIGESLMGQKDVMAATQYLLADH